MYPSVSADGVLIAFTGYFDSTNLVPGDTNGASDVFVHDRSTGITKRVSVSSSGEQANNWSMESQLSADGRWVAFRSSASNLVAGSTSMNSIYLHELASGATTLISKSSAGVQGDDDSFNPAITPDGRFIAFDSYASNLVPGDTNWAQDIFVHDRSTGAVERVSYSTGGQQADFDCDRPAISADGRFVAFNSYAPNLAPGDTNGTWDAFVRDRMAGTTTLVGVAMGGGAGNHAAYGITISDDGRYAAFASSASDLVAGDTNNERDVFLRDLVAGTTSLVSMHGAVPPLGKASDWPQITPDGRFVAFNSAADDLVPGDTNGVTDVFVRDLAAQTTVMASRNAYGVLGDGMSGGISGGSSGISPDGRFVAFHSAAQNLVDGPSATHGILLLDRQACSPTVASTCPAGTTTHGCVPTISAAGTASASAGSGFTLTANLVEGGVPGLIFYGVGGPASIPWGSGTLCVKPPLRRMSAQSSGGTPGQCDGMLSVDWNAYIAAFPYALGNPFADGATVWAQAWFRDSGAAGGSNLSNGVWFDVCP